MLRQRMRCIGVGVGVDGSHPRLLSSTFPQLFFELVSDTAAAAAARRRQRDTATKASRATSAQTRKTGSRSTSTSPLTVADYRKPLLLEQQQFGYFRAPALGTFLRQRIPGFGARARAATIHDTLLQKKVSCLGALAAAATADHTFLGGRRGRERVQQVPENGFLLFLTY
ncbi:hypothetical protein MPTK2_3g01410 [Marchantia polymorpha subsp. ruderalis]